MKALFYVQWPGQEENKIEETMGMYFVSWMVSARVERSEAEQSQPHCPNLTHERRRKKGRRQKCKQKTVKLTQLAVKFCLENIMINKWSCNYFVIWITQVNKMTPFFQTTAFILLNKELSNWNNMQLLMNGFSCHCHKCAVGELSSNSSPGLQGKDCGNTGDEGLHQKQIIETYDKNKSQLIQLKNVYSTFRATVPLKFCVSL